MTSKVSTIYDKIRAIIPTLGGFNTKFELPTPENLNSNPILLIKNGWGVIVGDATPSANQEFRSITIDQSFSIVLTRDVFQTSNFAAPSVDANKYLLEDSITIIKRFLEADDITIPDSIQKIDYVSTSPIEFVIGDNIRFRTIRVNFNINVCETIEGC